MVKIYLVGKSMAVLLHTKKPIGKVLILLHTERIVPYSSSETVGGQKAVKDASCNL